MKYRIYNSVKLLVLGSLFLLGFCTDPIPNMPQQPEQPEKPQPEKPQPSLQVQYEFDFSTEDAARGWIDDGTWANYITHLSTVNHQGQTPFLNIEFEGGLQLANRFGGVVKNKVYVIDMTARFSGQVENFTVAIRRIPHDWHMFGRAPLEISDEWRDYRIQIRADRDEANDVTGLYLGAQGVGTVQIARLRISVADEFDTSSFSAPDRGQLLVNSDFNMGNVGWVCDQNQLEADPDQGGYRVRLSNQSGFRLMYAETIRFRYGTPYQLSIEGSLNGGSLNASLNHDGYSKVREWNVTFTDGRWTGTYTPELPEYGALLDPELALRIEHSGGGESLITRVTLTEGAAESAQSQFAVQYDVQDPYGTTAIVGETIGLTLRTLGLDAGTEATLILRDLQGRAAWQQPVRLARLGDGTIGAQTSVSSLAPGWYDAALECDGVSVPATPSEISIIPKLSPEPVENRFLGFHLAYFDIIYDGQQNGDRVDFWRLSTPGRLVQARQWGITSTRTHPPGFPKWMYVEPQPGVWNFQDEGLVDEPLKNDITTLGMFASPPRWASSAPEDVTEAKDYGGGYASYPPKNMADWERYVKKTVSHYKGRITEWEVWNEPNNTFFAVNPDSGQTKEEAYVALVKHAWLAAKEIDPNIKIIAGATAGGGQSFLLNCFSLGMLDYCDAISFHGYGQGLGSAAGPGAFASFVEPLREAMRQAGKIRPIWDTEAGPGDIVEGREGLNLSDLMIKSLIARRVVGIERFYGYSGNVKNYPGHGDWRALVGFNERPLVSQPMLACFDRLLTDGLEIENLGDDSNGIHLYSFKNKSGRIVLAGWVSSQQQTTVLQQVLPQGRVLDVTGTPAGDFSDGQCPLTKNVRYFVGHDDPKLTLFGQ